MPGSAKRIGEPLLEGVQGSQEEADTRSGHEQSTESEQNPAGKEETEPDTRFADFQAIIRFEFVRHIVLSFFGASHACEGRYHCTRVSAPAYGDCTDQYA